MEAAGIEPDCPAMQKTIATIRYVTALSAWLQSDDIDPHELTRIGKIVEAWPTLPEHIQLAVEALCLQHVERRN